MITWDSNDMIKVYHWSNLLVFFDRPLASFTTNIYIQNAQTITRQDFKLFVQSFAFENNLLPHTMQQFLI